MQSCFFFFYCKLRPHWLAGVVPEIPNIEGDPALELVPLLDVLRFGTALALCGSAHFWDWGLKLCMKGGTGICPRWLITGFKPVLTFSEAIFGICPDKLPTRSKQDNVVAFPSQIVQREILFLWKSSASFKSRQQDLLFLLKWEII